MTLAVKLLADTFWYCAILAPAFLAFNRFFRLLFGLALPVWWIWVIKNRRQKDLHGVLKDQFLFEARLLMGIGAFELLFLGPAEWQRRCGIFVALYLLCGVFMLRAGRLEENGAGGKGFLPRSAGTLAGMVLAAAILSSGTVYRGVLGLLGFFYERLVLPVLMVLFQLLMGLLSGIFGLFPEIEPLRQEAQMEISGGGPVDWGTEYASLQAPEWIKMLGMLIPLIAAGLLLRFLYRRFTDMGNRAVLSNHGTIERSAYETAGKERGRLAGIFEKRTVRYYYRKFLGLCKNKGLPVPESATSSQIQEEAKALWPEEPLEEFHALYQRIRYGSYPETETEKRRAKELYRQFSGKDLRE